MNIKLPREVNLKPCAVCGSKVGMWAVDGDSSSDLIIDCGNCSLRMEFRLASGCMRRPPIDWSVLDEAEKLWNNRPIPKFLKESAEAALKLMIAEFGWGNDTVRSLARALDGKDE